MFTPRDTTDQISGQTAPIVDVFDRAAQTYDRVGAEFFSPMGAELVRLARLAPGARVLDVGCGRGAVLQPAAEAVGPSGSVVGIDLAPAMVELTRAEVRAAGLQHVTVIVDDAQRPDRIRGPFDAILAGMVLFLMPDPPAALRTYHELLKPGGRIGFTTFAAPDPAFSAALTALAGHLPSEAPRHSPVSAQEDVFATTASTAVALRTAGFAEVTAKERAFVTEFDDDEHFNRWAWSHGARMLLERIPASRLAAALAAAAAQLESARQADGRIRLTTVIRFTFARRSA
ncbi:class I SAM-dependent methyltransferase [Dactylosporangium sp. CA-233914]|uniref:class I SAM-dependent methyltransferase n=1 Tax=Dactylosporangium sp. CA-233914 TaxID=3239934 RepID=UPI003D9310CD